MCTPHTVECEANQIAFKRHEHYYHVWYALTAHIFFIIKVMPQTHSLFEATAKKSLVPFFYIESVYSVSFRIDSMILLVDAFDMNY